MHELMMAIEKAFYDNGYGASSTVCPECRVDDFCHTVGCSFIGRKLNVKIAEAVCDVMIERLTPKVGPMLLKNRPGNELHWSVYLCEGDGKKANAVLVKMIKGE